MNETAYRAMFADALAKGAMTQEEVDAKVADALNKGTCKSDEAEKAEAAEMGADDLDKAATALKETLAKAEMADANGWENASKVDTGATDAIMRPPGERTPIKHDIDFSKLDPTSIMTDLVKANVELFQALGDDINTQFESLSGRLAKAIAPMEARIKALVADAKLKDELIKGLTRQGLAMGESLKKAASRAQVDRLDALIKARPAESVSAKPAPSARQPPFQRPNLADLTVVRAPGDAPARNHGRWDPEVLSDKIDAEVQSLQKGGQSFRERARLGELADAALKVASDNCDADRIAHQLGYGDPAA